MEAEAHGAGETLLRHERELKALAKRRHLYVGEIYREIESGDTIAGRPEMQRLLADVEDGRWAGVLVMEASRLARGDTADQGRVQQAFYYSHTLIITPQKDYNPDLEADQEYFEFGLFMARREYKMINRRLINGRRASAKEGKWVGAQVPYGYTKVKLERQKGNMLVINPVEAEIVKNIFSSYLKNVSLFQISKELNLAGLKTARGNVWNVQGIRQILDNPVYCGYVRYGYRKEEKYSKGGQVYKHHSKREMIDGENLFPGLHEPIISKEMFEQVRKKRAIHPETPGAAHTRRFRNPLAGLMYCSACGKFMVYNEGKPGSRDRMFCANYQSGIGCENGSTIFEDIETLLLNSLKMRIAELELPEQMQREQDNHLEILTQGLASAQKELDTNAAQKERAYELVEKGIYTVELFTRRINTLQSDEETIKSRIEDLQRQIEQVEKEASLHKDLVPKIRHVVDLYPKVDSAEEKNKLLKTVISNIIYCRPKGSKSDKLSLKIYYLV